ncbi:MAG TPA: hypothetical protein VF384_14615 [Planctomycetota bacterium]
MKTILAMASFAAFAATQSQVCVSGVVQPVTSPTICMQGETHYLAGTSLFLRSTVVPLAQFVGQNVRVQGPDIGLVCRVLDVTAIFPAPARLESCGTPMPGCSMRFKLTPGAIGQYGLFGSLGPGFAPLGCAPPDVFDGSLLLGWPLHTFVIALFTGPAGDYVWPLPNTPAIQGVQVWMQGARQDIGPIGPIQFTNLVRFTIVPFMPPCGGINC